MILSVTAMSLFFLGAVPASPQAKPPAIVSGEWEMSVDTGGGQYREFVLKLEQNGEEVSGAVVDRGTPGPLEGGRFLDNELSFGVSYQGALYQLKAALKGETLEGTWLGANGSGAWKARKKASNAAGQWQCRVTSGRLADQAFTLDLNVSGSVILGTASSVRGAAPITKGSLNGNQIEITIDTEEGNYSLTGTLEEGKLKGGWRRSDGREGTWEGERK